nr:biliverdin-producing heme oxygenase [uncultured Cohaesibacter sp.]
MNIETVPSTAPKKTRSRTHNLWRTVNPVQEMLDQLIMEIDPFSSREQYLKFLKSQYRFHFLTDIYYTSSSLLSIIPDIRHRRRLPLIRRDIVDLGGERFELPLVRDCKVDIPTALGWLYVAESAKLGSAFYLHKITLLGLTKECGAGHLSQNAELCGLHWRKFAAALDAADFSDFDEERLLVGAEQAYENMLFLIKHNFFQ